MTGRQDSVKLLYVDALNQMQCFSKYIEFWDCLSRLQNLVRTFMEGAKAAGIEVKVFLDATYRAGEALEKWKKRRIRDVVRGERNVPPGFVTLVADAFKACGVEVHFSWSHDNDTTLAAWAVLDGADILSTDYDFFRYKGRSSGFSGVERSAWVTVQYLHSPGSGAEPRSYRVFKRYSLSAGNPCKLVLHQQKNPHRPNSRLTTPSIRPQTRTNPPLIYTESSLHPTGYIHMRGVSSALVKSLGNLCVAARPLRQALYARLGIGSNPVLEIFPVWDASRQKACFTNELVCADSRFADLLSSPLTVVDNIFPPHLRIMPANVDFVSWSNHVFAMYSIVFEICLGSGLCKPGSLLQMLQEREKNTPRRR